MLSMLFFAEMMMRIKNEGFDQAFPSSSKLESKHHLWISEVGVSILILHVVSQKSKPQTSDQLERKKKINLGGKAFPQNVTTKHF